MEQFLKCNLENYFMEEECVVFFISLVFQKSKMYIVWLIDETRNNVFGLVSVKRCLIANPGGIIQGGRETVKEIITIHLWIWNYRELLPAIAGYSRRLCECWSQDWVPWLSVGRYDIPITQYDSVRAERRNPIDFLWHSELATDLRQIRACKPSPHSQSE